MKIHNKKPLALGYLLPMLCGLSLSPVKAETTSSFNKGPYLGLAVGFGATYGSEFKTMAGYRPTDASNTFFLPAEFRGGYQFVNGNFVMPVQLAVGYNFLGDQESGNLDEKALAEAERGLKSNLYSMPSALAKIDDYSNPTQFKMGQSVNLGLRFLPGVRVSDSFSLHAIVGPEMLRMSSNMTARDTMSVAKRLAPSTQSQTSVSDPITKDVLDIASKDGAKGSQGEDNSNINGAQASQAEDKTSNKAGNLQSVMQATMEQDETLSSSSPSSSAYDSLQTEKVAIGSKVRLFIVGHPDISKIKGFDRSDEYSTVLSSMMKTDMIDLMKSHFSMTPSEQTRFLRQVTPKVYNHTVNDGDDQAYILQHMSLNDVLQDSFAKWIKTLDQEDTIAVPTGLANKILNAIGHTSSSRSSLSESVASSSTSNNDGEASENREHDIHTVENGLKTEANEAVPTDAPTEGHVDSTDYPIAIAPIFRLIASELVRSSHAAAVPEVTDVETQNGIPTADSEGGSGTGGILVVRTDAPTEGHVDSTDYPIAIAPIFRLIASELVRSSHAAAVPEVTDVETQNGIPTADSEGGLGDTFKHGGPGANDEVVSSFDQSKFGEEKYENANNWVYGMSFGGAAMWHGENVSISFECFTTNWGDQKLKMVSADDKTDFATNLMTHKVMLGVYFYPIS